MTTTEDALVADTFPILPEVWQDENGYSYWSEGHVEPFRFLLACLLDVIINCGGSQAEEFLNVNTRTNPDVGRASVTQLAASVEWRWARPSAEDEEQMDWCSNWDEGAAPFTRMSL